MSKQSDAVGQYGAFFEYAQASALRWQSFSDDPTFHDARYWALFTSLFIAESKAEAIIRRQAVQIIMRLANVKEITAQKTISKALEHGFIQCEKHAGEGNKTFVTLSDAMRTHCTNFAKAQMTHV